MGSQVILDLTKCIFVQSVNDALLKLVTKYYKILVNFDKVLVASKFAPTGKFTKLCSKISSLTDSTFKLMDKRRSIKKSISDARKEKAIYPSLIFQIESHEAQLIKYGKQSKVDLAQYVKKREETQAFEINSEKIKEKQNECSMN